MSTMGAMEDFMIDDVEEYLHLALNLALNSEKFFIIIGRDAGAFDEGAPIVYHMDGQHPEDVLSIIEATINEVEL